MILPADHAGCPKLHHDNQRHHVYVYKIDYVHRARRISALPNPFAAHRYARAEVISDAEFICSTPQVQPIRSENLAHLASVKATGGKRPYDGRPLLAWYPPLRPHFPHDHSHDTQASVHMQAS